MELGEKLRQARLAAGLSQRQLCGDTITRNMLSAIEHGTARPSMDTLQVLAGRLGRSVSYFLEEPLSPNDECMDLARQYRREGRWELALEALSRFREPDELYLHEKQQLHWEVLLCLAEEALSQGRDRWARELLQQALAIPGREDPTRALLLQSRIRGADLTAIAQKLPSIDPQLMLLAREASARGDLSRARALLEAVQNQADPQWCMLRGHLLKQEGRWQEAAECFHRAQPQYPREARQALEICYRELGDYRKAYHYAREEV